MLRMLIETGASYIVFPENFCFEKCHRGLIIVTRLSFRD